MFRFTIRELLLLTVIVAVSATWWIDRSRLAARLEPFHEFEQIYTEYKAQIDNEIKAAEAGADARDVKVTLPWDYQTDRPIISQRPTPPALEERPPAARRLNLRRN